ncbi:hypothetical protein NC653_028443 [Populus alba x Populus x berolinensis]|uniref:Uncharacterized protein n=1 Tax=Populus alba x Populus x berolinensis TaxID=444605 RepID=A0AAD6Q863_9ROSI|nr:hypothetical protein NC653_028443 [Populus alba x Populus x berolinensis]
MANSPTRGSPPHMKGFGLKKWRRIRRDIVKDASAGVDNSKVLKRVSSALGDEFVTHGSNLEYRFTDASAFSVAQILRIVRIRVAGPQQQLVLKGEARPAFSIRGDFSVTSNGTQSGRSMNYDGENSDEAHAVEQQFGGGVQTSYGQENVGEVEDFQKMN